MSRHLPVQALSNTERLRRLVERASAQFQAKTPEICHEAEQRIFVFGCRFGRVCQAFAKNTPCEVYEGIVRASLTCLVGHRRIIDQPVLIRTLPPDILEGNASSHIQELVGPNQLVGPNPFNRHDCRLTDDTCRTDNLSAD
jgi:hypothetical protein